MTRASWKHHAAVAALLAAPVVATGTPALAQPQPRSAPAAAPSPADVARATAFFQKGSELLKLKKYQAALEQFRQSYAAVPSPNSHLYIARCLALTGDTRAAYVEFDRVVDEAGARATVEPKYAPARDSARVERDELAPRLGLLTINVVHPDPASVVYAGAYTVPADRWGRPYPIEPGTFDARIETPGRAPVKSRVTLGAGDRRELTLDALVSGAPIGTLPPPVVAKSKLSPLRVGGFVAVGVGVVGLGMFIGGGVTSSSTFSDLTSKCGSTGGCKGHSASSVSSEVSSGKTQQLIANVGLGVGIAGAAVGATLIVLSTRKPKDAAGQPTADLVAGPSWLGARGEF